MAVHSDQTPDYLRGVRRVLTYRDATGQHPPAKGGFDRYSLAFPVMNSAEVHNYGDPVALVVAETYEQARAGATLVDITYAPSEGYYDFVAREAHAFKPEKVNAGLPTDSIVGDFDTGQASFREAH